ncbi:MAG: hypothetical protein AAFU34_15610 [Pseudomonadota bacterium]
MSDDPKKKAADQAQAAREQMVQLGMFEEDGAAVPAAERGRGRPPGSRNRINAKLRELLTVKGYADPAERLAQIAGLDRPDLHPVAYATMIAESIGESTGDVLKVQRQALADLLPYFHKKLAPDVAIQQSNAMFVTMGGAGAPGSSDADAQKRPPEGRRKTQENQDVSENSNGAPDAATGEE